MSVVWEKPEFLPATDGLATTIDNVSITVIEKDEGFVMAWSINAKATLPDIERMVALGASALSAIFTGEGYDWTAEGVDDDLD